MDLRPWDLWSHEGEPRPETPEVLAALEGVLARNPRHPAANHYYIHAVEASAHPEKALASAQRLGELAPAAGHLVHMPAHIFMRMGRYEEAAEANRRAILAEDAYIEKAKPEGFHWMYVAHNPQFLMAAAAMQGKSEEAVAAARRAVGYLGPEMLRHMPGLDLGLAYPQWMLVRFGRWDDALSEPAPPADFPFATAMWHAGRALAFSAQGKAVEAERERAAMTTAAASVPADANEGNNPASRLLAIASGLVGGELALRAGRGDDGLRQLQEAVRQEDALTYNEPSDWYYPVRHHLGAALLALGRAVDAQAVYEEDLRRNPENGWALVGLAAGLRAGGRAPEAAAARARFTRAWQRADVPLVSSRF
jgi:tetratricopeptide (TPR) repeat protein